jgi:flagellin-specific chaperone FliS
MTLKANVAALILATLIAVPFLPALAQNATSTTNTTTTETNTTLPLEATQLPVFPEQPQFESDNQTNQSETQPETQPATNKSESKDNATKVIGLLDDAQVKIDEARNIIRALQAQVQEEAGDDGTAATNDTEQIIQDANDTAEDIKDIVESNLTDSEVISDVGNITEDIEQAINDTIDSASNATVDNIENLTDEAIEAVENATDNTENATIEVALDNGMIRLLTGLVSAQDYNQGLSVEERDDLKANLQDAIAELASDAADSLR